MPETWFVKFYERSSAWLTMFIECPKPVGDALRLPGGIAPSAHPFLLLADNSKVQIRAGTFVDNTNQSPQVTR